MTRGNFLRLLAVWILVSLSILLWGSLTGFYARNFVFSLIVTIGLGLINALIWPILSDLALARSVIAFSLSALLVNGVIIWLLAFFTSEIGRSVASR